MCTKLSCQEFIITIPFRKTGFYVCNIELIGSPACTVKFMATVSAGLWPEIGEKNVFLYMNMHLHTEKYKYNIFRKTHLKNAAKHTIAHYWQQKVPVFEKYEMCLYFISLLRPTLQFSAGFEGFGRRSRHFLCWITHKNIQTEQTLPQCTHFNSGWADRPVKLTE